MRPSLIIWYIGYTYHVIFEFFHGKSLFKEHSNTVSNKIGILQ